MQIPIFISLYRALTNLVAENKLGEAFLWIPSLEGPVYARSAAEAGEWLKSIFSGSPLLGWPDTLAFLSLPLILYVSQSISQKLLQPPKDPNRVVTEQEQMSQGILNNLPLIVAFFSINVPAGLAVYWIVNNILTTLVTVAIKSSLKDDSFPPEVSQLMASVSSSKPVRDAKSGSRGDLARDDIETRPKAVGFAPKVEKENASMKVERKEEQEMSATNIVGSTRSSEKNKNGVENMNNQQQDEDSQSIPPEESNSTKAVRKRNNSNGNSNVTTASVGKSATIATKD